MTKSDSHHHTPAKDNSGERFSSDLDHLQKNFTHLREDVGKLLNTAAETAKDGAGAVKSRAAHAVGDLKDRGADAVDSLAEKIGDNPIASLMIALGIGFVVAKLMSRK